MRGLIAAKRRGTHSGHAMRTLESTIDTARIYRLGATVERVVEVDVPESGLEAQIPGLPLALLDPTARVRVESFSGEGELVATNVRIELYVPPREEPAEDPTEEQIREVRRDIQLRSHAIEHLELEMALLGGIDVPQRPEAEVGKAPPASPMSARLQLEEFVEQGLRERNRQLRQLADELEAEQKKLAELEELKRLASNKNTAAVSELSKSIVVKLDCRGGAGRAVLRAEYFVPGARWAPAYQFRLAQDGASAEIRMRALISQASGEDWDGVRLVLSTAAPMRWTELPELTSIRIGRAQPSVGPRGFRPPPTGATSLFSDFDRGRKNSARLLETPPDQIARLGTARPLAVELDRRPPRVALNADAGLAAYGGAVPEGELLEDFDEEVDMLPEEMAVGSIRQSAPEPTAIAEVQKMRTIAPAAPPAAPSRRSAKRKKRAPDKELAKSEAMIESRSELAGSEGPDSFVYTDLVLPPATDGGRNRLRPVARDEAYQRSLESRGITVAGDWRGALRAASQRANANGDGGLPSGSFDLRNGASSFFDFSYEAESRVDVPSDGGFHSVFLSTRVAKSDVQYVTVPREDPQVYRVAKVRNPDASPLLPGPAEVYVGEEYVLTTRFPVIVPFGEFQLGLGVEQAIKCARNTRYEESRSGDQVVATNELHHGIDIELVNNLPRAVKCEVRERIPQPGKGAEVVVEEEKVEPSWSRYKQEERTSLIRGGRKWTIEVPPNDKTTLRADYVVKIYANNELAGGNRREV